MSNIEHMRYRMEWHRMQADEIEGRIKDILEPDKVFSYHEVTQALTEARTVLDEFADWSDNKSRKRVARARWASNLCNNALERLTKEGEL